MSQDSEQYLVFINIVGKNWEDDFVYEFIFSNTTKDIDGEDWDEYPAAGKPSPPKSDFVSLVGNLKSDIKFDVIQNSDTFTVWDGVDGVVAIGWENIDDYDEYPDSRMFFMFGETLDIVTEKLYSKDIILDFKKGE